MAVSSRLAAAGQQAITLNATCLTSISNCLYIPGDFTPANSLICLDAEKKHS